MKELKEYTVRKTDRLMCYVKARSSREAVEKAQAGRVTATYAFLGKWWCRKDRK